MSTTDSAAATTVRIALRWRDIDLLGHLNQAVYHELLEEGRGALLASLEGADRFPFVVARVELDYRREVRRSDEYVDVRVTVQRVGRSSITINHDILRPDGSVAATGLSVLVAWDLHGRGSRTLSDAERTALEARIAA